MMAAHTEILNPKIAALERELLDKHYFRKHGADAYYGQK
jgi:L-ribulose-5-phosphate 4-epimerase